jgi:hypothetical protein
VTRDAGWQRAARRARLLSWLSLAYMAAEGLARRGMRLLS